MFDIQNLHISIQGKEILKGFSLSMKAGEIHAIMGPNGAGKSTLAQGLMGHPSFEVKGKAMLEGENLLELPTDERARKGVFLGFQSPPEIEGVSLFNFLRKAKFAGVEDTKKILKEVMALQKDAQAASAKLGMGPEFLKRELNLGFSGGERKRNEMLQMEVLKPKVVILDEIDSGLDIDGVKLVAQAIKDMNDGTRCFLLITHYPRILEYVKPTKVHVLSDGKIVQSGGMNIARELEKNGYGKTKK